MRGGYAMTKRERIYAKYNGRCAYTGKPLGDDWQIDHISPKLFASNPIYKVCPHWMNEEEWKRDKEETLRYRKMIDGDENLFPALRIVNHYKRSLDLEGFRDRMMTFHERLKKLPKKTSIEATRKRIWYMTKVADAFGITPENPFSGKFYFETIKEESND